ncbi:MAG: CotH kinase family protein [Muribaculaceae bacterium]|nr:CotH kinase family protein [Muribaculaceae bacterium]
MKRLYSLLVFAVVASAAMAASYSGTLPVMYINTAGGAVIDSKETYVEATAYIDNLGLEGYESLGSAAAPLPLLIKGRGNHTWEYFDKKPYRLKFNEKQSIFGMPANRHWVLLAHADDDLCFLRDEIGFQLSRLMEMKWTPGHKPVEVVLNGDYIGLYFIAEKIRVGKNRVNIVEQPDEATDPEVITGGWLIEIDNYWGLNQVKIWETEGHIIRFVTKTPENRSTEQTEYLRDYVTRINNAIHTEDKSSKEWQNYIDVDTLSRFYVMNEVIDNAAAFHGSCYMHKEIGTEPKWIFGPVWDFGNTLWRDNRQFIDVETETNVPKWIGELRKFPDFQEKFIDMWHWFYATKYPSLDSYIDSFVAKIASAAVADYARWPEYGCSDPQARKNEFKRRMAEKVAFLLEQWGEGSVESVTADSPAITDYGVYDLMGRRVAEIKSDADIAGLRLSPGIYIHAGKKIAVK